MPNLQLNWDFGPFYYDYRYNNFIIKSIHFSGAPYVHPIPELKAVVGKEFSFICPASGYPIERITWNKGKMDLTLIY